jgi:H+-translocating NAD(P) transhydrogenase subunit alpha
MKIAVLKETRIGERRVAATPDTVKKLIALGAGVAIESGAGEGASLADAAYAAAGALVADKASVLSGADIVLKVVRPTVAEVAALPQGGVLVAMLSPHTEPALLTAYNEKKVTAFALEYVPRITRAQVMDVLSSQSNLAGYRAVLEAAHLYGKAFPMMMTAAGTVPPAKVLVMGAGVAGLQAIATAKRLGAVVSATDVRLAAKEQVESLGGKFVMVDYEEAKQAETSGGYAKEMSEAYKAKQAELIANTIKTQDIVITTALIPGRKAPQLVSAEMVASMKPGSVIIDMAAEAGGNCALTKAGETIVMNGVTIFGQTDLPSRIAADSSALFARNVLAFVTPLIDKESKGMKVDLADEIQKASCLTQGGATIHPNFLPKESAA